MSQEMRRLLLLISCLAVPAGAQGQRSTDFISYSDYPAAAAREGREGITYFRLTVGKSGRVKNCTITRSSGHGDLDAAACRIMVRRAHFTPARDEKGRRVENMVEDRLIWKLAP